MQEKTILEWFEQAKANGLPWADAAIANCRNKTAVVKSLADVLFFGFSWKETPEGSEYWLAIHEKK